MTLLRSEQRIPLHLAPRAGRGRNASLDAFRVRGSLRKHSYRRIRGDGPSPQPSPRKNGERERSAAAFSAYLITP